jgi:RHS repeat-associated protein
MVSKDAYYPFGMRITGLSQTVDDPDPRYKYNGKELDEEKGLDWLAYGARYYDPEIGRWHVVDPAEQFWNSYGYCLNQPVQFVDKDGQWLGISFKLMNNPKWQLIATDPALNILIGLFGEGGDLEHIKVTIAYGEKEWPLDVPGSTQFFVDGENADDLARDAEHGYYWDFNTEGDYTFKITLRPNSEYYDQNGAPTLSHEVTHLLIDIYYFLKAQNGEDVKFVPIGDKQHQMDWAPSQEENIEAWLNRIIEEHGVDPNKGQRVNEVTDLEEE